MCQCECRVQSKWAKLLRLSSAALVLYSSGCPASIRAALLDVLLPASTTSTKCVRARETRPSLITRWAPHMAEFDQVFIGCTGVGQLVQGEPKWMASQYSSKSPARHECTAPLSLDMHNSHTHTQPRAKRKERRAHSESAQRNEQRAPGGQRRKLNASRLF